MDSPKNPAKFSFGWGVRMLTVEVLNLFIAGGFLFELTKKQVKKGLLTKFSEKMGPNLSNFPRC
jgi:hypothetical protein